MAVRSDHERGVGLPPSPRLPIGLQNGLAWRWPLWYLEQCRARFGSRFTVETYNNPPLVFLSDPDDVQAVLSAPADVLHPGEGGQTIEPIVGKRSFMLMEGDEHLDGRRAVGPAFQQGASDRHAELVAGVVERELAHWPREQPMRLHPRLRALTLEVILRVLLADADDREIRLLRDRLLAMMDVNEGVVISEPMARIGPRGRRTWRRFLEDRAQVDELLLARIAQRRSAPTQTDDDVLGLLLRARNQDGSAMPDRQVRDNLMSVVLAGHETTASELAWAFQLLAHNPDVQRRLRGELDSEYLDATVHEVLRHRPVFLFAIPRAVKSDIEIGGWTYEPPAHLLGCIYLMHHDASIPEPNRFLPERFLGSKPPATWLPWGGGRKICPGRHLALVELRTVLRTVLGQLRVMPAQRRLERARWRGVIATPHGGARVILR